MGVPSKIKAVKVFDDAGVELNDVVVTNSDDPPEVKKQKNVKSTQKISFSEHHHKSWAKRDKFESIC